MAWSELSYEQVLEIIASEYGTTTEEIASIFGKYNISPSATSSMFELLGASASPGKYITLLNRKGEIITYYNSGKAVLQYSETSAEGIASSISSGVASDLDLATGVSYDIPINTAVTEAGNVSVTGGISTAGTFLRTEVVPAIAAAGIGISLGKTIDSTLYNLNPDFWDSVGMSSLDPDTWSSITADDDSLGATVFNVLLGLDSETNSTQMYVDENAYAYLALYMQKKGVFDESSERSKGGTIGSHTVPAGMSRLTATTGTATTGAAGHYIGDTPWGLYTSFSQEYSGWAFSPSVPLAIGGTSSTGLCIVSMTDSYTGDVGLASVTSDYNVFRGNVSSYTYNGKTVTYLSGFYPGTYYPYYGDIGGATDCTAAEIAWYIRYGEFEKGGNIEGIGTQEGATTPDLSSAQTATEALALLKAQYPELWENAVTQDVVQPDGSVKTYTYVPSGLPNSTSRTDTQPTTGTGTQSDPAISPESSESEKDSAKDIISSEPPAADNSDDAGSGDSPSVIVPTGTAEALYKIYNPTQTQLNSFGAWLWSEDFVDQLLKLFNDPMQAIIGLHKVFCPVTTGGTSNIKVGYLDSGVSSKYVSSQYTTVNCGTVKVAEYFKNVFDYEPFTKIYIYLPFIGIEQLNVGDVMRSSVTVVYHVDVLTGACLAEVRVKRDGAGGTLYTYTGNCAVQYPLSSGSYMGIVSSIASVVGGAVGTIASGGAFAPVALGAAAGLMNAHTSVERSGGFSGNAGAMGIKKPYLIITRPQTEVANTFPSIDGYPTNYSTTLGECSGYTQVSNCHVEGVPATDAELSEIETLLKAGVIV